jgi:penicillin-binding protein 1A
MVSIRILQGIGTRYAQDYIARFGFDPRLHPPYLTMALGAGSVTPLQMAGAYSVFANGGYQIKPYYIDRVVDHRGNAVLETKPTVVGEGAERVIDPRNAFIMTSLMRDVVRYGTGAKAMALGRQDLAGKTGTTNDSIDAWFAGFNSSLVAVTWIGFDTPTSLGDAETGGGAALPIWMSYMSKALKGVPEAPFVPPEGVIALPINPQTGLQQVDVSGAITDFFYQEFQPGRIDSELALKPEDSDKPQDEIKNQLF